MQIGKPRATGQSTTPEQQEELLDCRMLMLGVYLNAGRNRRQRRVQRDDAPLPGLRLSRSLCGGLWSAIPTTRYGKPIVRTLAR